VNVPSTVSSSVRCKPHSACRKTPVSIEVRNDAAGRPWLRRRLD
jgi:hypothetical protein